MTYQKHTYMYEIKGGPLRYKPLFYHSNMDHPDPSDRPKGPILYGSAESGPYWRLRQLSEPSEDRDELFDSFSDNHL